MVEMVLIVEPIYETNVHYGHFYYMGDFNTGLCYSIEKKCLPGAYFGDEQQLVLLY